MQIKQYAEINDIPFVVDGMIPLARLVPSSDRTTLVERELTASEREWYWDRAEVNACVLTKEQAEELAWNLSDFDIMRKEVVHYKPVKPDVDVYKLYAIFDESKQKFLRPFMVTDEFYAKEYYMEMVWGPGERYKLYHIATIDRCNPDSPLFDSDMKLVEIDSWDRHDFSDCRSPREKLKENIEVHFGDERALWGLGY